MANLRNRILENIPQSDSSNTKDSNSIHDKLKEIAVVGIGIIGLAAIKGCIPLTETIFLVATNWVKHIGGVNSEKASINDEIIQFEEYENDIDSMSNVTIDGAYKAHIDYYGQCLPDNLHD